VVNPPPQHPGRGLQTVHYRNQSVERPVARKRFPPGSDEMAWDIRALNRHLLPSTPMGDQSFEQTFLSSLGNNVRRLRREKGWTQDQLAVASGLHRTYISGIERGERNVSVVNMGRLALALDVGLEELLHDALQLAADA
jgi:DNA-binding XRE family transcriptional regulator